MPRNEYLDKALILQGFDAEICHRIRSWAEYRMRQYGYPDSVPLIEMSVVSFIEQEILGRKRPAPAKDYDDGHI